METASACAQFDAVRLNFSETSLLILDITLFVIMFGVALNLKIEDFKRVIDQPKAPLVGLISQFLLLPALTLGLVWLIEPCPSMALGMFLVAACPGGNVSNFFSLLAKANVALSVSLSAIATLLAIFMTPFNFLFWSSFYPPAVAKEIVMDPMVVIVKILLILGIPLVLGMWTAKKFPVLTAKINKPIRVISLLIFGGYIFGALFSNMDFFLEYVQFVILIVFIHNLIALSSGFGIASLARLPKRDRRTVSIETGIQNSGVALSLIFDKAIFDGLGGMAMIAAMWGLWHLIAGLTVSTMWSRWFPLSDSAQA